MFYYINNYVLIRIKMEPSFYLEEFQISPFQSLSVASTSEGMERSVSMMEAPRELEKQQSMIESMKRM